LRLWHLALIVVAVVGVYANSLPHPFLLDDLDTIETNTNIRQVRTMFEHEKGSPLTGRPLVAVTFAANYAFGGTDPAAWRAVNLGIHLLCALLVYGIVRRTVAGLDDARPAWLPDADGMALAVALLWALHPLGSELINYVTQRTESLMALFFLLTLYASIRRRTVLAIAACAAGTLCKESMITAPVVVLLYDRAFFFESFREAFRSRGRLYLGLALSWIVLAIVVATQSREFSGGYASATVSSWTYLMNQAEVIPHYLRLVFWPDRLVAFYGWAVPRTLADVWPQLAALAALVVASFWWYVRNPRAGFLAVAFFLTLAPASSVVPIAAEVGADRRMYLPLVALIALVVVAAARVLGSLALKRVALIGAALTLVAAVSLGAGTISRNQDYASELTLSRTVLDNWGGAIGHHMVGLSLLKLGRDDEAIVFLRQAAEAYPNARYDLGTALFRVGQTDEAVRQLQRFVADEPNLFASSAARTLIGRALASQGRTAEAVEYFRQAIGGPAPDPAAHGPLADLLLDQKAFADAATHFRAYLDAYPSHAPAYTGLGIALASSGRTSEAIPAFESAVRLDPRNAGAWENLASALLAAGRPADARVAAERAKAIRGK
jgi:tetratricopeptide (TPR) repeat protein